MDEKLKSVIEYDAGTGLFRYKQLLNSRKRGWFGGSLVAKINGVSL
jgi:hypothetical protein